MLTACLLLLAADYIRLVVPQQQALVVAGFRTAAINVLIATSVGSEGGWVRRLQAAAVPNNCNNGVLAIMRDVLQQACMETVVGWTTCLLRWPAGSAAGSIGLTAPAIALLPYRGRVLLRWCQNSTAQCVKQAAL